MVSRKRAPARAEAPKSSVGQVFNGWTVVAEFTDVDNVNFRTFIRPGFDPVSLQAPDVPPENPEDHNDDAHAVDVQELAPLPQELADKLESLAGQLEGDVTAKLYRIDAPGKLKGDFLDEVSVDELDEKVLKARYGGGIYHYKIYRASPDRPGKVLLVTHGHITIAGPPKAPEAPAAQQQVLYQPPAPQKSTMDVFKEFATVGTMFLPIIEKFFSAMRPVPEKPRSMMEMLQELEMLQSLTQPAPPAEKSGGMMEGAMQALLMALQGARQPAPQQQIEQEPQAANEGAAVPAQQSGIAMTVEGVVQQLIKAAAANEDPKLYAAMLIELMPEFLMDRFLNDENWWPQLVALVPGIEPYPNWVGALREHVIAAYDAAEAEEIRQAELARAPHGTLKTAASGQTDPSR